VSIEFSNTRILRIHGNAIFGHGQPLRQPLFDGSAACVSQDRDGRPAQRASRRNDAARYQKHGPRSARSQLKTSLAFQAILNARNRSTSRQMHGRYLLPNLARYCAIPARAFDRRLDCRHATEPIVK
jgi:hypothetical protein